METINNTMKDMYIVLLMIFENSYKLNSSEDLQVQCMQC